MSYKSCPSPRRFEVSSLRLRLRLRLRFHLRTRTGCVRCHRLSASTFERCLRLEWPGRRETSGRRYSPGFAKLWRSSSTFPSATAPTHRLDLGHLSRRRFRTQPRPSVRVPARVALSANGTRSIVSTVRLGGLRLIPRYSNSSSNRRIRWLRSNGGYHQSRRVIRRRISGTLRGWSDACTLSRQLHRVSFTIELKMGMLAT